MFKEVLAKVVSGKSLTREEARKAMGIIMDGEASPEQISGFLTALRMKNETVEEIVGFVETMRNKAYGVLVDTEHLLDTCGTGGDGGVSFNISTASAIVAAAGGVRVAKHGNRAVSSKSGSADVLESLGVNINLSSDEASKVLEEVGLCFLFAPLFHQAMKHAVGPRRQLGFRTVFNLIGPLTNPANADRQLIGIYDHTLGRKVAEVMKAMGTKRALVVAGADGLDEISISGPTFIVELNDGIISEYTIEPEQFGLTSYPVTAVAGGNAAHNAEIIHAIFSGEKGANRDIVLLNSAASLYLDEKVSSLADGVAVAQDIIDSGKAAEKLQQLIDVSGGIENAS